jgi:hypothetical protein
MTTIYVLIFVHRLLGVPIGGLDIEVTTEAYRSSEACEAALKDDRVSYQVLEHPAGIVPFEALRIECRPMKLHE